MKIDESLYYGMPLIDLATEPIIVDALLAGTSSAPNGTDDQENTTGDHRNLAHRDAAGQHPAASITYDNESTGLPADNAQQALDLFGVHLNDGNAHSAQFQSKAAAPTIATAFAGGVPADNHVYALSVSQALQINAVSADICPRYGSHFIVTFTTDADITLNCLSVTGDSITDAVSGETWEISIFRGRCVVKKMQGV